ncbi:MAG: efflux RND transporter periplasmic adaptor subunit [Gammaproteobacteria bacterium]|nr:efflux RND transporter periplasmic adaptor subunit [Gammaproteobacteria bacterium]
MRIHYSALILVFVTGISFAAPPWPQGDKPPPTPVRAQAVRTVSLTKSVTAVGSLRADETVVMKSEIEGRILQIHFTEGQTVKKGAKLVSLDPAETQAQLASSSSEVRIAQLTFDRLTELFGKGLSSRQDLDQAQARLDQAKAKETLDKVRFDKTVITAPFDGMMGLRQVSPGALVDKNQAIATLEKINPIQVEFQVPEVHIAKLRPGQDITLTVDARVGKTYSGRIYALDTAVEAATRSINVRARLSNTKGELRPGMFARVALPLGERADALVVPEQAIVPKGQDMFVFKVVDGKAMRTPVQLGQRRNGEVEVVDGVKAGDIVVTDGMKLFGDGMPVMVQGPIKPAGKK